MKNEWDDVVMVVLDDGVGGRWGEEFLPDLIQKDPSRVGSV